MSCTIEVEELLVVKTPCENNLRRVSLQRHILENPCALSNDHKFPVLQCCVIPRFEQASEILSRFEGTDVEKEGTPQSGVEFRFLFELELFTQAIRDNMDFRFRHPQAGDQSLFGKCRDSNNCADSPGKFWQEPSVENCKLAFKPLRMIEGGGVMNSDYLIGAEKRACISRTPE